MFAAFASCAHLGASACTKAVNSFGFMGATFRPCEASRSRTSGCASVLMTASASMSRLAGGGEEGVEAAGADAGQTGFVEGRHIGQRGEPRGARHRHAAQAARLDVF